jgi:hypothetical protein
MKTLTLKSVNKKIQEKYPTLKVVKAGRVFIAFESSDPFLMEALNQFDHRLHMLNEQSIDEWLKDADWAVRSAAKAVEILFREPPRRKRKQ